jgi:hypothetical protein
MHANSLANLKPNPGGEVRNPEGKNGKHPVSDALRRLALEPVPEIVRAVLNANFRRAVRRVLRRREIPDLYQSGITWSEANSVTLHLSAVLHGYVNASVEIRESTEGRAAMHVDFVSQNDKLEQLLEQFRIAAAMAETEDEMRARIRAEELEKKTVM